MNRFIDSVIIIFAIVVLFQYSAIADDEHGDGHFHPDSLH